MGERFRVGDLVIMRRASRHTQYNGFPAVVTGGLAQREAYDHNRRRSVTLARSYQVRILAPGDRVFVARPYQLRRLHEGDQQHRSTSTVRKRERDDVPLAPEVVLR